MIKRFPNICGFWNGDNNKLIFLSIKWICRYEYMDSCKKYDEKLLPDMEDFYSNLNMEDIIYAYIYIWLQACQETKENF